ncbi:probable E3 ubiquitin-protein ligase RHG1A isoform X2 [Sesamum indicum]|uniref:RING-type E3 ubiquitin transferase n=1 Tax=Sesamum indicum TaxID=4182 RepID=A0A8M8V1X3_SESIN|nr:probable E3 ubiquitin-protein ligase RHG1A isoform X2 [Sesamum indicum]
MNRFSDKRGGSGLVTPRRGYTVGLKDKASEGDQNAKFCNRIGCSGRIKYTQNTKIGSSDIAKSSKPSIRPSNVNERTRKFSSSAVMTSARKSYLDSKRKLPSQLNSDSSGSSPLSVSEASELMSSPSSRNGYRSQSMKNSGNVTVREAGSSSLSSKVRPRKVFHHKSGSGNQNTPPASYVPSASKSSALGPFNRNIGGRNGLRNMKSNLTSSDVLPTNCSPPKPVSSGKNMMKKRSSDAESGASRTGRKIAAASPVERHLLSSSSGISISDSRRNSSSSGSRAEMTGDASVWTQRLRNVNTRMRPSCQQNGRNSSSVRESSISISQIPDNGTPFNVGSQNSLPEFSESDSSSGLSSDSLSSSDDDTPSASTELGFGRNREVLHRQNMDNIAEQRLVLESSFFYSGRSLYDQHRDLRLDIDGMSYEELLALEERMGTVSTPLSEEALSKSLRRSIYQTPLPKVKITESGEDEDDVKCSICQEEYAMGDEFGELVNCHHGYHATCIQQWLQLKNWCPICKASAAPSQS